MNFNRVLLLISIVLKFTISYAQYDSIPYGGYDRTYNLHLPIGYTGSTSIPLIIALHGGGHSAIEIESMSGLSLKADLENFIVVYPEGVKGLLSNARTWNAGECCGYASFSNIDDVGFIDALIIILASQYNIDPNRIYATGVSNGGFFAYRLACELSNKIASIAPVASSMTLDSCTPDRPVSIIHFHSVNDTRVPYQGGVGSGLATHYNPPIDSIINIWSNINICLNVDDTIINNGLYTFRKWSNCECGNEIIYYLTQDGGHSWPGGIKTTLGDSVSNYINATDLMWDFFQQHTLCPPLSIENETIGNNRVEVYPNPTNRKLKFYTKIAYQDISISVFTITGQKILITNGKSEIDISHLTIGTYFVLINIDGSIKVEKIIKIE